MPVSPSATTARRVWSVLLSGCVLVVAAATPSKARPLAAQSLSVERLWEVGGVDGPPEAIWMRIRDATLVGDRVYAVDIALPAVRGFTVDGSYVGEVGREGQGPSEFARPVSIAVVRDSLWIYDLAQDRYTIFDALGNHGRTPRMSPLGGRHLTRVWAARHGWHVGMTGVIGRSTPGRSIPVHRTLVWNEERVDTLATFDGKAYWRRFDNLNIDSLRLSTVLSLGPEGGPWVLGDSLLVQVDGARSLARIFRITPGGPELERTRSLPGRPRPLTPAEREGAIAWYFWFYGLDPDGTDHHIVEVVPPDSFPAWSKVLGDGDGAIWLRRGGSELIDPDRGERWMRWSLEDGSLDWVELPPGVEALRFREGYMLGKRRGDFEVEWLVLYRVHGW